MSGALPPGSGMVRPQLGLALGSGNGSGFGAWLWGQGLAAGFGHGPLCGTATEVKHGSEIGTAPSMALGLGHGSRVSHGFQDGVMAPLWQERMRGR